ncbi:MAG: helix-turn-helix transcriptional regulator [Agathobacter sp.]|nr:helix-turn-helix transcriptional regulator [Agathobacter sp.]
MLKDILLEKRKQRNMTQEQLAEQLGVARQTVSKWELGETLPDVENLKKMAILFEFSIDEALGLEVEKEDDDDEVDSLMFGGFIIGSAIGIYFDNAILMFVCTMIGYGLSVIIKAIRKNKSM